jgi:hypothetical protein
MELGLYAQASNYVSAVAGEGTLNLAYMTGHDDIGSQFLVGTNSKRGKMDVVSREDGEGIRIKIEGMVDPAYHVAFSELIGGTSGTCNYVYSGASATKPRFEGRLTQSSDFEF